MASCSFLCDDPIVDADYYPRLECAVREVVEKHDETEFLFAHGGTDCALRCLCAVLETKQRYPHKQGN